jgi:hypothetical protein
MMKILIAMFGIFVILFTITILLENIAENLPKDNKFKRWWRDNIIGDDIYGNDF